MVTFTVDKDYRDGEYPERYSYDKGELVNKYDATFGIMIGSSVPIVSGDVLKFTISRMTGLMYLYIWDEKYGNGMGYLFQSGYFHDGTADTKW